MRPRGAPLCPPLDSSQRHLYFFCLCPSGASSHSPLPSPGPLEPPSSPLGVHLAPLFLHPSSPLLGQPSSVTPEPEVPRPPSRCTLRASLPSVPHPTPAPTEPSPTPTPPPWRPPLPQPGPASRRPGARLLPPSRPPYPMRRPLGTGGAGRGPGRPGLPLASAGGGGAETSGSSGPAAPGTRARGARARGREGRRRRWKRAPSGNAHAATNVPLSRSGQLPRAFPLSPGGAGGGRRLHGDSPAPPPLRTRREPFGRRNTTSINKRARRSVCLMLLKEGAHPGLSGRGWAVAPAPPARQCQGREQGWFCRSGRPGYRGSQKARRHPLQRDGELWRSPLDGWRRGGHKRPATGGCGGGEGWLFASG